jgi:ketosteroid isomerase-like protein
MSPAADVVLEAFRAVEGRDHEALVALYHPNVEFHEAPSLPYGGMSLGKERAAADLGWLETWGPLQPTAAERSMDPRVISAAGSEVVMLYRQRAIGSDGELRRSGAGPLRGSRGQIRSRADVSFRHRRNSRLSRPSESLVPRRSGPFGAGLLPSSPCARTALQGEAQSSARALSTHVGSCDARIGSGTVGTRQSLRSARSVAPGRRC